MKSEFNEGAFTFYPEGRIDSNNASAFEAEIMDQSPIFENVDLAFDAENLEYISSAGLRVLLSIKKATKKDILIRNVSDEVFDIFDVTGFSNIFRIERQMRQISLKGCEKISSAINGEIFQLSEDEMIKVYDDSVPLADVKKERTYAQTAMAFGVPTLIPYDVVKCEKGYGIVYEKAGTTSLAYLLSHNPERLEQYAAMLGKLLKELHSIEIPEGKLPDIKDRYRKWIDEIKDFGDHDTALFSTLMSSIPDKNTYVHGDINLNSVMVQNGELLLIDMAGSACGNPLYDMSALFGSLVAIGNKDEGYCRRTYGVLRETCVKFWNSMFRVYMNGNEAGIKSMTELLSKYFILKEKVLLKVEAKHRLCI